MAVLNRACARHAATETCCVQSALNGACHMQVADGGIVHVGEGRRVAAFGAERGRDGMTAAVEGARELVVRGAYGVGDGDVAHQQKGGAVGNVACADLRRQRLPVGGVAYLIGISGGARAVPCPYWCSMRKEEHHSSAKQGGPIDALADGLVDEPLVAAHLMDDDIVLCSEVLVLAVHQPQQNDDDCCQHCYNADQHEDDG